MSMIAPGRYRARCVDAEMGFSGNGREQIGMLFQITDGEYGGWTLTAYGFFTENSLPITIKNMRTAGWKGTDLDDLSGLKPSDKECEIVVRHEMYEGETKVKIAFINEAGSSQLALRSKMTPEQKKSFAAKLKGQVLSLGQPLQPNGDDDDLPF